MCFPPKNGAMWNLKTYCKVLYLDSNSLSRKILKKSQNFLKILSLPILPRFFGSRAVFITVSTTIPICETELIVGSSFHQRPSPNTTDFRSTNDHSPTRENAPATLPLFTLPHFTYRTNNVRQFGTFHVLRINSARWTKILPV